jgi:hypothetical protein
MDWAKEYGALYVHCGGSPDALARIIKKRVLDLNEFYNAKSFWRETSRPAPHNVYTSSKNLSLYLESRKSEPDADYATWKYKNETDILSTSTMNEIFISGKRAAYDVRWAYDKNKNIYERSEGGIRHKDENGDEINSKNIIIAYMKEEVIDEKGRINITTSGKGNALICLDGKCEKGKWVKEKAERIIFYNLNGEEAELNPGITWIEVLPTWAKVTIE